MKNIMPVTAVHSYHSSVAADVGINAAVLFYNICFWVAENTANERNFVEGKYWTYNTVSAYAMLFPEFTKKQVRTALEKLEDFGYIESGCFNKEPTDRTKWYTVTDRAKAFVPIRQMEMPEKANDNNIYNNLDIETDNKRNSDDKQTDNSHKSNTSFAKKSAKEGRGNTFSSEKGNYPLKEKDYVHKNHITEYTQEQLEKHISSRVEYYMEKDHLSSREDDDEVEQLEKIILYFYERYYKQTGKRHPIISDYGYRKIVDAYMKPPDVMHELAVYEFEYYKPMIDKYFETDFNARGKFNGKIELSLSHFMSDRIREYLFYQTDY